MVLGHWLPSIVHILRYVLHNVYLAIDDLKHTFVKQMAIVIMADEGYIFYSSARYFDQYIDTWMI